MGLLEKPKQPQKQQEFQAIILAGYGSSNRYLIVSPHFNLLISNQQVISLTHGIVSRLYPITEEDNLPKALLPVANKPLISYTLDWLEKAGIFGQCRNVVQFLWVPSLCVLPPLDAIVLTQAIGNAQQKLSAYLARGYQGGVHCNLIAVDEDFGTADAIRSISDRITVGARPQLNSNINAANVSNFFKLDRFYYPALWLAHWTHSSRVPRPSSH